MKTVGALQEAEIITLSLAVGTAVGTSMAYILFMSLRALLTII